MPTASDLEREIEQSLALTQIADIDITNLLYVLSGVSGVVSAASRVVSKAEETSESLSRIEAALTVVKFVPVPAIKTSASLLLKLTKSSKEAVDETDRALGALERPLQVLDSALDKISTGLTAARLLLDENISAQTARDDALEALFQNGALRPDDPLQDTLASQANYESLVGANDLIAVLQDAAEPARTAFEAVEAEIFDALAGVLNDVEFALDTLADVTSPFEDTVDNFLEVMQPLQWAFDASQSVIEEVVDPVVDAFLEATGLDQLMEDLADRLETDVFNRFSDLASQVLDKVTSVDVAERAEDFWASLDDLFDVGGPMGSIRELSVFEFDGPDGQVLLGTQDGDDLQGSGLADNFVPIGGDDDIFGGAGIDRAWYLGDITEYRIRLREDLAGRFVEVDERLAAAEGEGEDELRDVELLRFNTEGLGDVPIEDIERFIYADEGAADVVGTDADDYIFGDDRANALTGGLGDDRLFGGTGADQLAGDLGSDSLFGGAGDDLFLVRAPDASDAGIDAVYGGEGFDTARLTASEGVIVDFATGGIDYGSFGIGVLDSVEIVEGSVHDDIWLGSDAAETVGTGGGNDIFMRAGQGDIYRHFLGPSGDPDDWGVATISFAGAAYSSDGSGVRVAVYDNDTPGEESFGSHSAVFASNSADRPQPLNLANVSVVEGTDALDAFYALGSLDGFIAPERSYAYTHEGTEYTLDGNVFLGGAGTDVVFASELTSLFDGGDGFDLVNFSLDAIKAREVTASGVQDLTIDLQAGTWDGGIAGRAATGYLLDIEGVVGTRGDDLFRGDDDANYYFAYQGADTVLGGGGNDVLDLTGTVNATASGGAGDDVLVVGWAEAASVDGGAGTDTLDLRPNAAFRLDHFVEEQIAAEYDDPFLQVSGYTVTLGSGTDAGASTADFLRLSSRPGDVPFTQEAVLFGIENIIGSDLGDTLSGNSDGNMISGWAGDDAISGGAGDDALDGGTGVDTLSGGAGDDVISGGDESGGVLVYAHDFGGTAAGQVQYVTSTGGWTNPAGNMLERWGEGVLSLTGQGGMLEIDNDATLNEGITQTFATEAGAVYEFSFTMRGRPGLDPDDPSLAIRVMLNGTQIEAVSVAEAELAATPSLSPTDDWLTYSFRFTGTGADTLTLMETDALVLVEDMILNTGQDARGAVLSDVRLVQLGEADLLSGGDGRDTFMLRPDGGRDEILDFTPGVDRISLEAFGVPFSDVTLRASGPDTEIEIGGVTVGLVVGQRPGALDADDFVIAPSRNATELVLDGSEGPLDLALQAPVPGTRFSVTGSEAGDRVTGGAGEDDLSGGLGDDSLDGAGGEDSIFGGAGADSLRGGDDDDVIDGGAGDDSLGGDAGADLVLGQGGNDLIQVGGGDTVEGGDGDDRFIVDPDALTGADMEVRGGAGGEDSGDVLTLLGEGVVTLDAVETARAHGDHGQSGNVAFADGSVLRFSGIERIEVPTPPCFTPGTQIMTDCGPVAVERLRPGDRIITRDRGYASLRWVGSRTLGPQELAAAPHFAPVRIARGALGQGPDRDLVVSPRHRVLIRSAAAELHFGTSEALVAAAHLVGWRGITREAVAQVCYLHLLFDRHELILCDGAWTESFHPGHEVLTGMDPDQRRELEALFPDICARPAARIALKPHQVSALSFG